MLFNSSDEKSESPTNNDVMMKQGDIYLIQKGDIVSNKSTQAEVEFETKIETGSTTSQLISGEAVLKVKK